MQVRPGFKENTLELVFDDFSQGVNLDVSEVQSPGVSVALWMRNFEISHSGGLAARPDGCRISLRDPDTYSAIQESTKFFIEYARVGAPFLSLVATGTRLFVFDRFANVNLSEVTLEGGAPAFRQPVRNLDWETFEGRLYIASGSNPLLCWDGVNPAYYIEYEANYRFPSLCRRHMGRLMLSGFTDINDTRAQSQLRWTKIGDAKVLEDAVEELRTSDDDVPVGMASLQSGLVTDQENGLSTAALIVGKSRNTIAVYGSDWPGYSDIQVHPHTTDVGWAGPRSWCHSERGLYFASNFGVHLISGPGPAKCVSKAIAQLWGGEYALADRTVPRARQEDIHLTQLMYDPQRKRVYLLLPVRQ